MTDLAIQHANEQVQAVLAGQVRAPQVKTFFDEPTFTASYVVSDPATKQAAHHRQRVEFRSAHLAAPASILPTRSSLMSRAEGLTVEWMLETHAHADHLSAAPYLQEKLGGKLAIGRAITTVQDVFGKIFNEGTEFARDGSQFDRLLDDGDVLIDRRASR